MSAFIGLTSAEIAQNVPGAGHERQGRFVCRHRAMMAHYALRLGETHNRTPLALGREAIPAAFFHPAMEVL